MASDTAPRMQPPHRRLPAHLGRDVASDSRRVTARAHRAARSGTLPDTAHRLARDARQVPACAGVAAPRGAVGRRRRDLRSRDHAAGRAAGAPTLRRNLAPRACTPGAARSRHIPAAVRRDVWRRDAGRCAFVGAEGRCGETAFLEFHHVEPYAAGGEASVENIELRCRAHNLYEARLFFGADVVREQCLLVVTRSRTSRLGLR